VASVERNPGFPQPNGAWVERRRLGLAGEFRRQRRRQRQLRSVAVSVILTLAVTGALVGILGKGGPQPAYAGWTAVPTIPTAAEVRAAEGRRACDASTSPTIEGPTLAEARGPFVTLLFVHGATVTSCISDPGVWTDLSIGRVPPPPAPDAVGDLSSGFARVGGGTISSSRARAGSAVRRVTLKLRDGQEVDATVEHGWVSAWWPDISYPVTATVQASGRVFVIKVPPPLWVGNCALRLLILHLRCAGHGHH
jgi:hypothetical protein